MKKKIEERKT